MPIFDQGYQHWSGTFAGQGWRWWAVTRHGVRMSLRSRWTRFCLIAAAGPALTLVIVLILWSLLEQGNTWLKPILAMLPLELQQIPQKYRLTIWTFAFHYFFFIQFIFVMVLVLLVGPDLISKDIRFNALPLYLSRPLRRWEYFLGKLGVIGFFTLLVTAAPAALAWLLGALFSLSVSAVVEVFPLLWGSLLVSLVTALVCGLWMLALSSLARISRYVSMMFLGFWILTNMMSGALFALLPDREWPLVISFTRNLQRVEEEFLDTEYAWTKLEDIRKLSQLLQKQQQRGPLSMIPGRGLPAARSRDDDTAVQNRLGVMRDRRHPNLERSGPFRTLTPWPWSAGVLAGLGVLSLCILMFRVRSLDSLR
jgi:ABC-2 type transport system permease protein